MISNSIPLNRLPESDIPSYPDKAGKLLVVGAAVLDRIFYVDHFPAKGETVIGNRMEVFPGGKGANQALAAKRMGADVKFLTSIGKDEAADIVLNPLRKDGVILDSVVFQDKFHTAESVIAVNPDGENHIVSCPGAYGKLTPEMVEANEEQFNWANMVLMQNELPRETVNKAFELCFRYDLEILFNPAPYRPGSPLPRNIDLLVPNEIESSAILDTSDYMNIPVEERTVKWHNFEADHVIVTLGQFGVEWFNSGKSYQRLAALDIEAVDTVGAGDAFCGILAAFLSEGIILEDAIKLANIGAGISTTRFGAQEGLIYRKELLNIINSRESRNISK